MLKQKRDHPEELARMMKAWRAQSGISTKTAGEWLGLSHRTIEGIEQGRGFNAPRVLSIALISKINELKQNDN